MNLAHPSLVATLAPLAQSPAQAFINLLMGELGLAILIGGSVGLYLLWYLRGRDKPHGLVAEYLREPPSDLHPGLVGTLLDEHANSHDVVATLINLGRRGVIEIVAVGGKKTGVPTGYTVILRRRDLPLSKVEQLLVEVLFGTVPKSGIEMAALSSIRGKFVAAIPRFKIALYEEVVAEGYFLASPRETRRRYRRWGAAIMILTPLFGLPAAFALSGFRLLLIPTVTLTVIGFILWRMSAVMPAKTHSGVEEAARWRAFRRYLERIERYEDLGQAREIFNRYLPYATAFGLDRQWVEKFTRAHAPAPQWLNTSTTPLSQMTFGHAGTNSGTFIDLPSAVPTSMPNLSDVGSAADAAAGMGSALGNAAGAIGGAADLLGDIAPHLPDLASAAGGAGLEAASGALSGLLDAASSIFDW